MAVKTITIDLQAYTLLSRRKAPGQSFSQVIKAHFAGQPTVADLRARLRGVRLSANALDAIEREVRARTRSPARAVTW